MWWVLMIVVVVAAVGFFEWRSRNKPEVRGFRDHWGSHSAAHNGQVRTLTGSHDTDRRS